MLFKHHRRYYSVPQFGMDVALSFPKACDVLLGTPGVSLDLFFPNRRTESSNSNISRDSLAPTIFYVFQEVHGKDEYLQAIQVLAPRFRFFFVPLFLITKTREDRLSAFIGTFYLKRLLMTHLVTCRGRDHLVSIQSGRHNLVIVNVHFQPELTLRQLRDRLRLIHPHWPAYLNAVGIILGVLEITQLHYTRRDSTALGVIRTLSRIDRIFCQSTHG